MPLEVKKAYLAKISTSKFMRSISLEKAYFNESLMELKLASNAVKHPELGDKELYVISAGKEEGLENESDEWLRWAETNFKTWQSLQRDLLSKSQRAKHVIAEKSGHMIPRDQSEIIVDVVKAMIEQ